MSTIIDVARLAGVSHQTVSRVINRNPSVREATRKKVLEAIATLDYYPNRAAQSIQKRVPDAIGLAIPFSPTQMNGNSFWTAIISAVSNVCTKRGLYLNICSFDLDDRRGEQLIRMFREGSISGVILTCPAMDEQLLLALKQNKMPFVVIGRPALAERMRYVDIDNEKLAYLCAEHLLKLGHRALALVNGPEFMTYSQDLAKGFERALREYGVEEEPFLLSSGLLTADGMNCAREIFARRPDVTAIVTANDALALGVLGAANAAGRSIPEEISLVAGTESPWNDYIAPTLTAIHTDPFAEGEIAVRMLCDEVYEGLGEGESMILAPTLVVRDSCRARG